MRIVRILLMQFGKGRLEVSRTFFIAFSGKGGGALMNLIMNLADLGKSENKEFVENEKI